VARSVGAKKLADFSGYSRAGRCPCVPARSSMSGASLPATKAAACGRETLIRPPRAVRLSSGWRVLAYLPRSSGRQNASRFPPFDSVREARAQGRAAPCPHATTKRAIPRRAVGHRRACASPVASFAAGVPFGSLAVAAATARRASVAFAHRKWLLTGAAPTVRFRFARLEARTDNVRFTPPSPIATLHCAAPARCGTFADERRVVGGTKAGGCDSVRVPGRVVRGGR
jgi:hypothetical protein